MDAIRIQRVHKAIDELKLKFDVDREYATDKHELVEASSCYMKMARIASYIKDLEIEILEYELILESKKEDEPCI